MSRLVGLLLAVVAAATSAYKLPQTQRMSRRTAAAAAAFVVGSPAYALKPCPPGANNCYSSASPSGKNKVETWTWPKSATRDEALKSLSSVIDSYPQEGQSGVDLGGWSFADDEFSSTGYARLEFKSGIGNFARFMNGGKPFVDDLEFSVEEASVCLRSSSRVGDSDFGVNAKRINWIAEKLRAKGWNAPSVNA